MKSKRQRQECISRSFRSALKSMKVPTSQPFFHPVQVDYQPNLCPVSYNISPACCYQAYVPYIGSDINNGHYRKPAIEDNFVTHHLSSAVSNVPPIQALEAHVINFYENCNETHMPPMNNITSNACYRGMSYQQLRENLIQYKYPFQCSNITETVSLECERNPRQNMKKNSNSTKFNNSKSKQGKFFRPFES